MRPEPTRVETYCSKVLVKVPRWRRSKASTPESSCTPPSACAIVACEMPADAASADMLCTKMLKSPPQRAAKAGGEAMKALRQIARRGRCMGILIVKPNRPHPDEPRSGVSKDGHDGLMVRDGASRLLTMRSQYFASLPAVDLASHQRDRLLIDLSGVPFLDRCKVRLARLVAGAGAPAMGLQVIRGRGQCAGGAFEIADAVFQHRLGQELRLADLAMHRAALAAG